MLPLSDRHVLELLALDLALLDLEELLTEPQELAAHGDPIDVLDEIPGRLAGLHLAARLRDVQLLPQDVGEEVVPDAPVSGIAQDVPHPLDGLRVLGLADAEVDGLPGLGLPLDPVLDTIITVEHLQAVIRAGALVVLRKEVLVGLSLVTLPLGLSVGPCELVGPGTGVTTDFGESRHLGLLSAQIDHFSSGHGDLIHGLSPPDEPVVGREQRELGLLERLVLVALIGLPGLSEHGENVVHGRVAGTTGTGEDIREHLLESGDERVVLNHAHQLPGVLADVEGQTALAVVLDVREHPPADAEGILQLQPTDLALIEELDAGKGIPGILPLDEAQLPRRLMESHEPNLLLGP